MLLAVIACVIAAAFAPFTVPAAGALVVAAPPSSPKLPVHAAPLGQQPILPDSSSEQSVFLGQQATRFMGQLLEHLESRRKRSRLMRPL